ncbi:dTDP-4-dehydrorhamnose 3,5-epimerase family protein [Rhodococcus sp. 1168]|uniref:dTDP-4-dehydrorhamnose 3,5-epimerase family protein n=1 Tax=Rhodococcus sp. 1168 TaxID=2018041 RepID=UPI000A0CA503|nr:dTDP-4-dehydrorhamnose 3,5-epimerase [Rhodococcus sp. 1168]ORI13635.1 dTDP-4-dehydrorhamnose 3,5-epimerase [Rhodococcus sp. 1168]
MRVETAELADVLLFTPEPFRDERGLFTRTFESRLFDSELSKSRQNRRVPTRASDFIEDSQSRSNRGVVRGMHGRSGRGEAKLVRCSHGAVFDVLVDIRRESPTFGVQQAFTLDDVAFALLYVPSGFLHGFQALTPTADVCYRIDREHDPREDIAVAYSDSELAIPWPLPVSHVSTRDAAAGSWSQLMESA